MRRTFQRHRAANMVVGRINLRFGEPQVAQQVERRVVQFFLGDAEGAFAEILAQGPLVEDELDVKSGRQRGLDLFNLARAESARCG
jgi:hypothetical protein